MEMVAVIHFGQLRITGIYAQAVGFRQKADTLIKIFPELFLGDAADICVAGIHGDVPEVVEAAEDGEFANLGDAGEKAQADVRILGLHHAVEALELRAEYLRQLRVREVVHDGLVVLVNKDDNLLAGFGIGGIDNLLETGGYPRMSVCR